MDEWVWIIDGIVGNAEALEENPVPVQLQPTHIPHNRPGTEPGLPHWEDGINNVNYCKVTQVAVKLLMGIW